MASNLDDLEVWPLSDEIFQESDRPEGASVSNAEPTSWGFSLEEPSLDPASSVPGAGNRLDSDLVADIFAKSLWSSKADATADVQSLEQLMRFDPPNSAGPEGCSSSNASTSSSLGKRHIHPTVYSSSSKKSGPPTRSLKSDRFHLAASSSMSLGSFGSTVSSSSESSPVSSHEITSSSRGSLSPPLPRNLSLLSNELRSTLQGIVASRRQFLSNNRKSNLEKLYLEACPEEALLLHIIRTHVSKIPRDHSRLQLGQGTQALRHFIEMQLCIPFENFLITDPKLPGDVVRQWRHALSFSFFFCLFCVVA